MCEPCTRRTAARTSTPSVRVRTSSTQGPAALTTPRARMVSRLPVIVSSTVTCHASPARLISVARVRVRIDGAARGGVERVEQHQPRVVDEAVGVFEALREQPLGERFARGVALEIERAGRRQQLAAAEMVVKEQPEPEQPGRPQLAVMRQDEPQRLDDVRRHPPQHLALDQRLADQAEFVILEVSQSAVDQLGRPGRRPARQVIHFTQEN